jgi:hypothetical protein
MSALTGLQGLTLVSVGYNWLKLTMFVGVMGSILGRDLGFE